MPPLDFPPGTPGATYTGPNGVLAGVPELSEVFAGGGTVGSVGFLGAVERAEMDCAARAETGGEAVGPRKFYAFGEKPRPALVLHVLCVRGSPQIAPAVIVSDAVDVIDLRRFLVGDHLEDDAVGQPQAAPEFDEKAAFVVAVPGDVSRISGVPPVPFVKTAEVFLGTDLPPQDPGCRFVAETRLQVTTVRQNPVEVWHA